MAAINKAFVPDPDEDFKESSSSASLPPSMNLKVVCHVDQSGAIDETRARKLPQILAALPGKMIRPDGSDWVLLHFTLMYQYNIYIMGSHFRCLRFGHLPGMVLARSAAAKIQFYIDRR